MVKRVQEGPIKTKRLRLNEIGVSRVRVPLDEGTHEPLYDEDHIQALIDNGWSRLATEVMDRVSEDVIVAFKKTSEDYFDTTWIGGLTKEYLLKLTIYGFEEIEDEPRF